MKKTQKTCYHNLYEVTSILNLERASEAVLYAIVESVADKIREKAEVDEDGSELVDRAFGVGKQGVPLLALNSLQAKKASKVVISKPSSLT